MLWWYVQLLAASKLPPLKYKRSNSVMKNAIFLNIIQLTQLLPWLLMSPTLFDVLYSFARLRYNTYFLCNKTWTINDFCNISHYLVPQNMASLRPRQATSTHSCNYVRGVPNELRSARIMRPNGLSTFYQKYTEAYGIPILCKLYQVRNPFYINNIYCILSQLSYSSIPIVLLYIYINNGIVFLFYTSDILIVLLCFTNEHHSVGMVRVFGVQSLTQVAKEHFLIK